MWKGIDENNQGYRTYGRRWGRPASQSQSLVNRSKRTLLLFVNKETHHVLRELRRISDARNVAPLRRRACKCVGARTAAGATRSRERAPARPAGPGRSALTSTY